MDIQTIKGLYCEHYRRRGYAVLPSSPLVHERLPTAFVMSVGLLQLEPILARGGSRQGWQDFAMVQRCIRHYDMELVGDSDRLSFFEMAGAITGGGKSAEEIVEALLTFVFDGLGLRRNRVYFTVFGGGRFDGTECPADKDAPAALRRLGIRSDHIVALGVDENLFGTVPREEFCGPSLETFVDRGAPAAGAAHACRPGCGCGRFVEIGNTVFLRYKKSAGGIAPLSRVYGESALGVERTALATSNEASVHDLPELRQVREAVQAAFPGVAAALDANVCADHARAVVFAIAEGARPGHGGRRYVLRKLIRRLLVRLTGPGTDVRQALQAVIRAVADANRHILDVDDERVAEIVSVVEAERAVFENGAADPRRYLRTAPAARRG